MVAVGVIPFGSVVFSFVAMRRNNRQDAQVEKDRRDREAKEAGERAIQEAKKQAELSAQMCSMNKELGVIQGQLKEVNAKLDREEERHVTTREEIAKLDSSYKSLHKRVDRLEAKGA